MTRRARLSAPRIGILRAMLSRRALLILGNRTWFVRGWSTFVSPADVEALRNGGWIEPPADAPARGSHRLFVLTEAGRDFAAREAARALPPSRAEEIAA